jgi:hypothetical protein
MESGPGDRGPQTEACDSTALLRLLYQKGKDLDDGDTETIEKTFTICSFEFLGWV